MSNDNVTVYGIPNCDTVKKVRAWLRERGTAHDFVDFRETPLDREKIEAWVRGLGSKALRNTSGQSYRALPEEKKTWSDAEWTASFAADPMLIKRPVIEVGGEAVMAGFRKPDALTAALE